MHRADCQMCSERVSCAVVAGGKKHADKITSYLSENQINPKTSIAPLYYNPNALEI